MNALERRESEKHVQQKKGLRPTQTDATSANNCQHCWVLLANNVASVCMDLKVWPVSNYKGSCKRTQHCWAQQCCDLLRPFAWNHSNVGTCCVQFETGQTFGPTSPQISIVLWPAKRSTTMLRPFAWNSNSVGLVKTSAHAPYNIFSRNNRSAFSSFWIFVNMAHQAKLSE